MTVYDEDGHEIPLIGVTTPTASKDYPCDSCLKLIYKGERYLRVIIKPQGKFESRHYHYACA